MEFLIGVGGCFFGIFLMSEGYSFLVSVNVVSWFVLLEFLFLEIQGEFEIWI